MIVIWLFWIAVAGYALVILFVLSELRRAEDATHS